MTELQKSYSIEKDLNLADTLPPTGRTGKETPNGDETTIPVAVSYPPRINSKLILQNMEEVLHTVKKQHKEKHRRKKEMKKLAMIGSAGGESAMSNGDQTDAKDVSSHSDKKHKHRDKEKRHGKMRPLQEKSTVENGKVLQESPHKTGTILHHFQRTPKKDMKSVDAEGEDVPAVGIDDSNENNEKVKTPVNNPKVTNAFEVMMNARNKSIGSNTPVKDSPSPVVDKEAQELTEKRKLKLQEWADRKGAAKRKLEVETRALYVEEQLEQRAKRFKQMLVTGTKSAEVHKNDRKQSTKLKENTQKGKDTEKDKPKGKEKKKSFKPRVRRLSSLDSNESIEVAAPSVDKETEEFLSKLSSPTKKRDSLLGYFPKKESPKDVTAKQVADIVKFKTTSSGKLETPRRRGKKAVVAELIADSTTSSNKISVQQQENITEIGTPCGRPRRSCAGKARYDVDADHSPTKDCTNRKGTPARKATIPNYGMPANKSSIAEHNDSIVIVLDDSISVSNTSGNTTPQGTPKKLAPLFVRSLPKPSPDPEIVKARRAFLESGVPEKLRIEQEKQKQWDQTCEESTEIFPKIAHIRQLSEDDKAVDGKIVSCSRKLQSEESYLRTTSPETRRGKGRPKKRTTHIGGLSECTSNDFQLQRRLKLTFSLKHVSLPSLANKRAVIKNWKTEFERFPTFKCYNQMREKYRFFNAIDTEQDTEQVTESFVVTRRTRRSMELQLKNKEHANPEEEFKPPATAPNGELLFSEKYKPLLYEQVLVNLNPVTQLKDFLSSWSTNGRGSAKNSQNFDDSMDFDDSTSQGPSCNTVVLLGPVSSGKTNAVFALANEMNFNVLEINAGMKRTGKKLIQELQEATQSHQIRKDAAGSVSSQKKNLLKMSLNGLKSKTKLQNSNSNNFESFGSDSSNGDQAQSDRKCLILIEDADIVFEQTDAGFTDAIYTLAASSKRPVIVVASNPNCAHLQRLMALNTIHFPPQNVLNVSKLLSVLTLIENCPVLLDDIISLYLYNKRDLRKTLLEIQFFIQSGGDRERQLLNVNEDCQPQKDNASYFASPRKRQFSTEQNQSENPDNNLPSEMKYSVEMSNDLVYMHRSLFEFYTVCQNSKFRIPFPLDFQTFGGNLNDIFKVSRKLKSTNNNNTTVIEMTSKGSKRKSKSPKKQWLTNAMKSETPLDNLCKFYENVSVAALMNREDSGLLSNKTLTTDRINTNLSEYISHTLLETAIKVNLDADACPYNLFDTPKEIVSVCNELGTMQMRSKRCRTLDYEPSLRSICRSEKVRATLERRSTRFYHYLRTYTVDVCNFSSPHFDQACEVFKSFETAKQMTEPQPNLI